MHPFHEFVPIGRRTHGFLPNLFILIVQCCKFSENEALSIGYSGQCCESSLNANSAPLKQ